MFKTLIRKILTRYGERYDYDFSWQIHLMDTSPAAFRKLGSAGKLSRHREVVPLAAAYAAQLVAIRHQGCGTCIQLVVNMALEAKVPRDQIAAVLTDDHRAMTPDVALACAYATAVLEGGDADRQRTAVHARWGEKGLVDLALATQGIRLYPMLKDALGFRQNCRQVYVDDQPINLAVSAAA